MRMRTSVLVLVQVTGLIFPLGGALAASSSGYGSGEQTSAQPAAERGAASNRETTRASVLEMPDASSANENTSAPAARPDTPPRGLTKSRVLARYGKPLSQGKPIGQPPISRWDYPDYQLYFEYDHVLHAVVPNQPEPIAHSDELQTDN